MHALGFQHPITTHLYNTYVLISYRHFVTQLPLAHQFSPNASLRKSDDPYYDYYYTTTTTKPRMHEMIILPPCAIHAVDTLFMYG